MAEWISTKRAMEILGVGSTTIKRWTDENRLPFIRTPGGHRRFDRAIVERLLRGYSKSSHHKDAIDQWLVWLVDEDIGFVVTEIQKLRMQHADWFQVAEFLGTVTREIGEQWANGNFCIAEEHIASAKLRQALAATTVSLTVPAPAPTGLLATVNGERHTLGLSLTQLCLRSAGISTVWIGAELPVDELTAYVRQANVQLVGLSASSWQTDYGSLASYYQAISPVCKESSVELILGGGGAWPDSIDHGFKCRSFSDLKIVLRQLKFASA